MNTYDDFKHNNDMLHSLVNSKITTEKTLRLITIRTQMSKDIIQSMINYADCNKSSNVYSRLMDKVNQMKIELNQALEKDN
jgi:hypothetical protein